MEAKEPRGVFGNRWRACRGAVLMLGIGAGHLLILSVLALLPFLWDAYPRDLPNWTVLLVGLALVTAAGILTWQSLRWLARTQYRFRLRSLLAGMVVLCLILAVVGNRLHFASRCRESQQLLGRAGGYAVCFDPTISDPTIPSDRSWYRGLIEVLGLDEFQRVTSLRLTTDRAVEVLVKHPREFADVRRIELGAVTDRGLESLANSTPLRNLRGIEFRGSLMTDEGLKYLAAGDNLKMLLIDGCSRITDAGMAHLNGLSALDILCLQENAGKMNLTDACLSHIAMMPRLRYLALYVNFSDAGLGHLQNLGRLQWLELDSTKITDSGLVHLQGLDSLDTLAISNAKITDDGLLHLRRLVRLKYLSLSGTRVTLEGIEALRTALPDCLFNGESIFIPLSFILFMEC